MKHVHDVSVCDHELDMTEQRELMRCLHGGT